MNRKKEIKTRKSINFFVEYSLLCETIKTGTTINTMTRIEVRITTT